ncbi:MAG: DNA repair protein RecO [Syntrophomonadaceae bacterium]|nr:DNA repair protein RecO [Bacillota bacterium]
MAEWKDYGLVLRSREYREADRLVTLLTRKRGLLTGVARGVRKVQSKLAARVEPLTLGYYQLHQGRSSLATLLQGEALNHHRKLCSNPLLLAHAQYFCELCESSLPEHEPAVPVFSLLLQALTTLEAETQPARAARCFELNLLSLLGYRPVLDACLFCRGPGPYRFDPPSGGLVCSRCAASAEAFAVSGAAVAVMKRFLELGFYRLSVCRVPAVLSGEIHRVSRVLIAKAVGKTRFKSLEVLHSLTEGH